MQHLTAESPDHLLEVLSSVNIDVPPRGLGRTKTHTQTWAICRFLATFARSNLLSYPLTVDAEDRPDFVLRCGDLRTGVEATEAIHEDQARIDALRNTMPYSEPTLLQRIRPGALPMSLESIRRIAQGEVDGEPWAGAAVERDWAEAMLLAMSAKHQRLLQKDFRKFARNWLLIYDNWSLPYVDRHGAAAELHRRRGSRWEYGFDRVFIETGNTIVGMGPSQFELADLRDLWGKTTLG